MSERTNYFISPSTKGIYKMGMKEELDKFVKKLKDTKELEEEIFEELTNEVSKVTGYQSDTPDDMRDIAGYRGYLGEEEKIKEEDGDKS